MRQLACVLILLVTAAASAQSHPEGGEIVLTIASPGGSLPTYFSGTNCVITASAIKSGSPHTAVWQRLKLTITGNQEATVVYDKSFGGPPPAEPMDVAKSVTVRFASTRFQDQTQLEFKLEAWENGNPTPHVKTATAVAYNKALVLATKEKWDLVNGSWQWVVDASSFPATTSLAAVTSMIPALQALNHTVDPNSASAAANQTAQHLAPKFKSSTVFSTVTHGIPGGLRASVGDDMSYDWISDQIHQNRTAPPYNLVVIFACAGLPVNQANSIANKFGIRDGDVYTPQSVDQAMFGTGAEIAAGPPNDTSIAQWFSSFYNFLHQGYTVQDAEQVVYDSGIRLENTNGVRFRPVRKGDALTKLYGVYGINRSTQWYLVLSG